MQLPLDLDDLFSRVRFWCQLGDSKLRLLELRAKEALSSPYTLRMKLRSDFGVAVAVDDLVGTEVRASFQVPDPQWYLTPPA
ncbi:MAG: hypothetical protein AAGA03_19810, partial [Planctomycetota bacterium]